MTTSTSGSVIRRVVSRQIFDSRGNPTVEADVITDKGMFRAAVPSGASTGEHEAHELRDGKDYGYMGKGVSKAVENVFKILGPAIQGMDPTDQKSIDEKMIALDGTPNKKKLGANAILAVSLAVCKAGAGAKNVPLWQHIADLAGNSTPILPVPAFNIINGGSHASNSLAMQEFMILPTGAESFVDAMKIGVEIYHTLKKKLGSDEAKFGKGATSVGDEGGFAPIIKDHNAALDIIQDSIRDAGYTSKTKIGMDVAASEFYSKDDKTIGGPCYNLDFKNPKPDTVDPADKLTPAQLLDLYVGLYKSCTGDDKSALISIEDPFDQDDWDSWTSITKTCVEDLENQVQIVGDDLTVTNPERVQTAIDKKACNTLLLKVNQIGSVWESISAVKLAQTAGWGVMTSHRSGETEDTFIADLAVGLSTGQIKTGAPCRSERLAKYNRLLRIEEEAAQQGKPLKFAGQNLRDVSVLRPDLC